VGIFLLPIAAILGILVFILAKRGGWHWGGALVAAIMPLVFTFFMGILGLLLGFGFTFSIYKLTS